MAILKVMLVGVTALMRARSAVGLGAGLAQSLEPSSEVPPVRGFSSDELLAAGGDTDELDDFDTWYLEEADRRSLSLGARSSSPAHVSEEEKTRIAAAAQQCRRGGASALERGVITYLVTRPADLDRLGESLPRLRYFFLRHWAYDVKVFVPGDALREYDPHSFDSSPTREEVQEVVREHLGESSSWEIAPFDLKFPKVIREDANWTSKLNTCAKAVSTSYKHMNQFFTKVMYEHPSLDKYRYYLRIDADFNFRAGSDGTSIQADPFCVMARSGRKFMWQTRREVMDKKCTEGLWEWFQQYQQAHGLTAGDDLFFSELGARVNYVGYVGMGDLDFFRSKPVRSLARALNEDGRVYLNRWSDQTYYVLLFALFENHSAVGDMGFHWSAEKWCHKCWNPQSFKDWLAR